MRLRWAAPAGMLVLVGGVAAVGAPAWAATPAGVSGRAIVLRRSQPACLLAPGQHFQCFPTDAAMRSRSAQLVATGQVGCPVTLYTGPNYSVRALEIAYQGLWVNLSVYGFNNVAVSFTSTGCGFHLAQGTYGGGYWFPGYTGPWASSPNMGPGWNDAVSSVYIQ